jgi:hypothetical protein
MQVRLSGKPGLLTGSLLNNTHILPLNNLSRPRNDRQISSLQYPNFR